MWCRLTRPHHSGTRLSIRKYKLILMCAVAAFKSRRQRWHAAAAAMMQSINAKCSRQNSHERTEFGKFPRHSVRAEFEHRKYVVSAQRPTFPFPSKSNQMKRHPKLDNLSIIGKALACSRTCLERIHLFADAEAWMEFQNFSFMNEKLINYRFHSQRIATDRT